MMHQGVVLQSFFCFCVLLMMTNKLVESSLPDKHDSEFKSETAQNTESRTVPLSTSSNHRTTKILKPSQIRNKRNLLTDNEQFIDDNAGLDSAFLYSDQIMQNLLKTQSPKPLSYARSNFFINLLKPRTTRYNSWDDHSLMHFGKRSLGNKNSGKLLAKRSVDLWLQDNTNHDKTPLSGSEMNKHQTTETEDETSNVITDEIADNAWIEGSGPRSENGKSLQNSQELDKKSNDPWHSMMSFGKKSEDSWDHNTLHFGKKDDAWHHKMSFGKRSENPWDHSTMHFGKRNDPWHSMMSFGKKSDPWHSMMSFGKRSDNDDEAELAKRDDPWHNMMSFGKKSEPWHNMMSFGKRSEPWHNMMSFGKKSDNPWEHNTLHFGKKDEPWHNMMSFGKKSDPWHNIMSFGKKSEPWHNMMSFGKRSDFPWDHNTLHFGKRDDPWHNMMSFGKRSDYNWDHNTLHFGKRGEPWHSMMSFGKKSLNSDDPEFEKRNDPWHNMMSFGKKSENSWDHNTLHFGKKDEPWHNMLSFGKRSDFPWDHNTLHFGKKNDPWHSMMSFGKRSDSSDDLDLEKRDDPWHNMMSFGKKSDNSWNNSNSSEEKRDEPWHSRMSFGKKFDPDFGDHSTLHFGKRDEPWHNIMSFGKKSEIPWEHNTLHFGKKDEPWHNMMSFGKKSDIPWDHNTLHFDKRDEPWHNMMSFGKKSDPWHNMMSFGKRSDYPWDHNTLHFGKKDDPWHNMMSFGKKSDIPWDHNTLHFGKRDDPWHNMMSFGKRSDEVGEYDGIENFSNPWEDYSAMVFYKKADPWDHSTLHFGKKSNTTTNSLESKQVPETTSLKNIQKRSTSWWGDHETMHFGKKSEPWDYHNTMHFGKKNNPWDYHNTMHFGKRFDDDIGLKDTDIFLEDKESDINENNIKENEFENSENEIEDGMTVEKRSVALIMNKLKSDNKKSKMQNNNKSAKENRIKSTENHKIASQSQDYSSKITDDQVNKKKIKDFDQDSPVTLAKEQIGINNPSEVKDFKINENERKMQKDTKSRIVKRSVDSDKHDKDSSENIDSNASMFEDLSKDDFPDTVLHFGKRSIDILRDGEKMSENQWLDRNEEKRLNYWDSPNTLHFGKKSDPWESYTMHFGKRNPWDYHNTMHFGKKFDPWEGHHQMHFGKRSGDWDHSVMHFGKRDNDALLSGYDTDDLLAVLLTDPEKLKRLLQEKNLQNRENDFESKKLLEGLENFDVYLRDENIPFDEKLNLLKSYLKPILKVVLQDRNLDETAINDPFVYTKEYVDGDINNSLLSEENSEEIPSRANTKENIYEGEVLPNEGENTKEENFDGNTRWIDYLREYKDYLKSKRANLGKPELKRYFVPFQGPKSIVYPHAWFASQIRRSSLPRTTEFAKSMQMRMAEKKEDPFNSYMHFGRR